MLEPVGERAPELMRLVLQPCVSDPVPIDLLVIHLRAVECPMAVWGGGYLREEVMEAEISMGEWRARGCGRGVEALWGGWISEWPGDGWLRTL